MNTLVALTGVLALGLGILQLRSGVKATRVQRVIDLHRDLTAGEIGRSRDRFSTLMWKEGERRDGRNRCHAPTWGEIVTAVRGGGQVGALGAYDESDRIAGAAEAEPMRDLYAVLWCFERIEAGRSGRALDQRMLTALIASHAVWWDELTKHLDVANTRYISSLRSLASSLDRPEVRAAAREDFAEPS